MSKALLSVITVCFNDKARLMETRASLSLLPQDSFEWIVIDGGSDDGTKEYLESLDGVACRWLSERDAGIYDAMNKGLALAKTSYVYFLNAGDLIIHRGFTQVLAELGKSWAMIWFPVELESQNADADPSSRRPQYGELKTGVQAFVRTMPVCHQGIVYRRDAISDGYDLGYRNIADRKMTWNVLVKEGPSKVCFIENPSARYAAGNYAERHPFRYLIDEYRWLGELPLGTLFHIKAVLALAVDGIVKILKYCLKRVIGGKQYARLKAGKHV